MWQQLPRSACVCVCVRGCAVSLPFLSTLWARAQTASLRFVLGTLTRFTLGLRAQIHTNKKLSLKSRMGEGGGSEGVRERGAARTDYCIAIIFYFRLFFFRHV